MVLENPGTDHSWCSLYGTSTLPYFCQCLHSYPNNSLFLRDPHLPIPPTSPLSFGPAALLFLPCHICHRRSVAGVALGFKFNLVSICCNCFERGPCLHVFPLLCLLEYWIACVCAQLWVCLCTDEYDWRCVLMCACVCKSWTIAWPHTVNDTLCQTPAAVTGLSGTLTTLLSDTVHFLFVAETEEGRERGKSTKHDKMSSW